MDQATIDQIWDREINREDLDPYYKEGLQKTKKACSQEGRFVVEGYPELKPISFYLFLVEFKNYINIHPDDMTFLALVNHFVSTIFHNAIDQRDGIRVTHKFINRLESIKIVYDIDNDGYLWLGPLGRKVLSIVNPSVSLSL